MADNTQNQDNFKEKTSKIVEDISNLEFSFLKVVDISKAFFASLDNSSEVVKRIERYNTEIKNSFIDISNLASRLGTDYIKVSQVNDRIAKNSSKQSEITTVLNNLTKEYIANLSGVNAKQIKNVNTESAIKGIKEKVAKDGESSLGTQERTFYQLIKQLDALKDQEKILSDVYAQVESGNKEFTKTAVKGQGLKKIFDQLNFIPFLSSFMKFDIIADKFLISKKAGFGELKNQIKTIVTSPYFLAAAGILAIVAAFKALVKAALDFEKHIVTISNNLGFTRNATIGILDNFRKISDQNLVFVKGLDSAFLSVKNQAVATAELQEILGTNAMFTNKMVQSQILLTKQMGMSKEEAAGIQKLSLLSGKSADDILQNAISQNKTAISYRKIISDISKVNAEISVMYKNNPELIAKAVIEANKLGLSLEQTQQISKSLLDFETSIAGELEAELLTGQRFNFEKARALALDGKSVEASKELLDQMGGLNGLTKLNVIQRERLAASIGMSAAELTNAAREQEVLNKLGFQNKQALEEQYELMRQRNDVAGMAALKAEAEKTEQGKVLLQDIARANLQQRFQESVERIKQIFTEIAAGPIIKMIEGLARLLQNTTLLKGIFFTLTALATALAVKIALATGGISLLVGGLVAAGVMGSMSYSAGSNDQYTSGPTALPAVSQTAAASSAASLNNRRDLEQRMSSMNPPTAETPASPTALNSRGDLNQSMSPVDPLMAASYPATSPNNRGGLDQRMSYMDPLMSATTSAVRPASSEVSGLGRYTSAVKPASPEIPGLAKTTSAVKPTSPEMASVPQVPYSTNNYGMPPANDRNRDVAANTAQNKVIQNNIVLTVDGIALTTAQNKVDVSYA
jgi:hypothetical protein